MKKSTLIEVVAWVVCLAGMIAVARVATGDTIPDQPWSVQMDTMSYTYDGHLVPIDPECRVLYEGKLVEMFLGKSPRGTCDDYVESMNAAHARRMEREAEPTFSNTDPVIRMPPPPCQTGDQGCEEGKP